jgi:hypothetical protein
VPFSLATLTVLGVVCELLVVEKELLTRSKNELGVTVNALQNPVSKFHGFFLSATNLRLKQFPVIVHICDTTQTDAGASSGVESCPVHSQIFY